MASTIEYLHRLIAMSERVSMLNDRVGRLADKVDDHDARLVRLETIVEIARPDGATLRIGDRSRDDDRKT